jgi:hypothetical protein
LWLTKRPDDIRLEILLKAIVRGLRHLFERSPLGGALTSLKYRVRTLSGRRMNEPRITEPHGFPLSTHMQIICFDDPGLWSTKGPKCD